ncbi:hypothetical protein DWUX_647 [Desulfovibrio diazotrophicus]|nr:hypothetical protein DWUX_647 [Desulfovibrio diazotrophicus]
MNIFLISENKNWRGCKPAVFKRILRRHDRLPGTADPVITAEPTTSFQKAQWGDR